MSSAHVFRWGLVCFVGGTGIGLFFSWSLGWWCVIAAVFLSAFVIRKDLRLILLLFLGALFLGFSWYRADRESSSWRALLEIESKLVRAEAVRDPVRTERSKKIVLRPLTCSNGCPNVLVSGFFPLFADIRAGDRIFLDCSLDRPDRFDSDRDYPMVLAADRVGYVCRFPRSWDEEARSRIGFLSALSSVRQSFEMGLSRSMPDPEAALVAGLLVGGDDRLPESLSDAFSKTGLSHIVAVSGYNVSIVASILLAASIAIGVPRPRAFWVALLGIVLFTALVGAPASAVRAAIMSGFALFATRLGRLGNPVTAIAIASSLMLFGNPLLLRYDIGFQLSFAATIGIFLVAPSLLLSLRAGDIVGTTLAAELFVLPLLLFHFHALPTLSLVANVFVLPLVPLAMLSGFIAALSGILFPALAPIFGFPAFLIARSILFVAETFSRAEFSSIGIPSFGAGSLVAWYVVLIAGIVLVGKKYSRDFLFPFHANRV